MRRLLLSLLGVIVSIASVNAGKVTEQQALQKAQQFMKGKKLTSANTKALSRSDQPEATDAFYIFNAENKGGFVIVSGDDRTVEILGYSDHGELIVDKAPCNVKWLLECYKHVLDSLALEPKVKAWTRNSSPSRTAIEPLIKTQWGQGAPYNNMCPEIDGQKCVTGCVATAMAQIINYHQWPQGYTSGISAYTTGTNGISMPQLDPTSFNWNEMTDDEIARLMLYCGQSVNMDYDIYTSGAGNPESVFKDIFGYSKAVAGTLGVNFSPSHWEEVLYNDLENGRPVYYSGSNSLGGHAFVVDGYKDGLFHINWGWDGDGDGYFLITGITEDIMPYPYDYLTDGIFGIEAPANDVSLSGVIVKNCSFFPRSVYRNNSSEDFQQKAQLSSNLLCDYDGVTFQVGYGLY